jgi:hypothetical protein
MADITFNCPRLTWPALANAGPVARKMSATSSAGRDMRAALLGGRRGCLNGFERHWTPDADAACSLSGSAFFKTS